MLRMDKLSPEELKIRLAIEREKYKEVRRQADREFAWLYARNMAIMDAEERGEEWVEPLDD